MRDNKKTKDQLIEETRGLRQRVTELEKGIFERKRADDQVHLLLMVTEEISKSKDFFSAIEGALEKICEVGGWDYGEAWIPNEGGTGLEYCPVWYCRDNNFERFVTSSREVFFPLHVGLPGRIMATGEPEWIPDISSQPASRFLRVNSAREAGLRAIFGVPIISNGKFLSVLAFATCQERKEESQTLDLVSAVTIQLGDLFQRKQTEQKLRESEEKYRALMNDASDAIFLHSTDGSIIETNNQAERLLGYRKEEILHGHFSRFVPEEETGKCQSAFEETLRTGSGSLRDTRVVRKYGRIVPIDITGSVIEYGGQRVVQAIVRDITPHKQVQDTLRKYSEDLKMRVKESEERFRAIFEQAAVGVAQIETHTGNFVRTNLKYCDIVGYTHEEMLKATFMDITHPDDLQDDLNNMKKLAEGTIRDFTMEKRCIRKDGSIVWVNLTVSPMWDAGKKPNYHIAVVEDITGRKMAEEKLKEHSSHLEELLEERTLEVKKRNEQLQKEITKRKKLEKELLRAQKPE